jgi:hypothetical protein
LFAISRTVFTTSARTASGSRLYTSAIRSTKADANGGDVPPAVETSRRLGDDYAT